MPDKLERERQIQVSRARERLGETIEALRLAGVLTPDDDPFANPIEAAHNAAQRAAEHVVALERELLV